ncbi:MAG TPA: hypothetical protein VGQ99_05180 [Tepidisphaeraceae bacterium]|jgi:hypothetical protein|nr:hypothetical protein [Tepidisphaeraceae bacterium]
MRILLCILMLLPARAMAAVEVTLPLAGYWRPGRYVPVRVEAREAGTVVEIGGEGVVRTRLPLADGRADVIVPLLVMSEPGGIGGRAWRQLGPEQRLVGFTTIDIPFAQGLFPGDSIVPIQLAAADPLPGAAVAWETLDAVVLDNTVANIPEQKLRELGSCGVIVARRPGEVNRPNIIGPRAAAEDLAAFAPVQGWAADWPKAFRRGVLLCAVAFSIVALGVGLMRFRHSAVVLVLLCAGASGGLWMWWRSRPAVLTRCGAIVCRDGALAQRDLWVYQATASGSDSRMSWAEVMRPYFESRMDRDAMRPVLVCGEDGMPREFEFHLMVGQKVGFLMRSIVAAPQGALREQVSSPLERLAKRMYLREGVKVVGESDSMLRLELPKYGEQWPTVVIEAQSK